MWCSWYLLPIRLEPEARLLVSIRRYIHISWNQLMCSSKGIGTMGLVLSPVRSSSPSILSPMVVHIMNHVFIQISSWISKCRRRYEKCKRVDACKKSWHDTCTYDTYTYYTSRCYYLYSTIIVTFTSNSLTKLAVWWKLELWIWWQWIWKHQWNRVKLLIGDNGGGRNFAKRENVFEVIRVEMFQKKS